MLKIALLNLPFAAYHLPSIGLTQLKAVIDRQLAGQTETRIHYVNHDFANDLGLDLYDQILGSADTLQAAFPEWFFRQAAFPELADNAGEYFGRYFPGHDAAAERFRRTVEAKRRGVDALLDAVIDRYRLAEADVVGMTSMFFENNAAFAMARRLKARRPGIVTVMGGATCESPAGEEFGRHVEALDYVCSGPALQSFPLLLGNLLRGEPQHNDRIDGVFSKANRGQGVGPIGEDLDINVPIELDYEPFLASLAESFPAHEIKAVLPFETSRGCWWGEHSHCTFCGLNKSTMGYRAMRPDLAVELIRSLFKYADRAAVLMCVDNILQRQYVKDVFPFLETPAELAIFYQLKANLTEREVAALARARVKAITPGFESLSTATLKLMEKGVTAFHNLQVMKYCALHDVYPGWNLLIGSPGEGEATYEKYIRDLPAMVHLPAPQGLFSIHFNRYSPYFVNARDHGLDLEPLDFYDMVFPFGAAAIANIAYDFADRNLDAPYLEALGKWIDRIQEKIRYWQLRWQDDQPVPPRLFLRQRQGQPVIHDSRHGRAVELPISETQRQLLARLESPCLVSSLAAATAAGAAGAAAAPSLGLASDLAWLRSKDLLFEEGEKVMSLVLPAEPPPMTCRPGVLGVRRRLRQSPAEALVGAGQGPIVRAARRAMRPGAGGAAS
jgi:ribosomal peptide maturation radical SAM protein 1